MNTDSQLQATNDTRISGSYVIYYRSENTVVDAVTIKQLQHDTGCYVSVVDSWSRLITELSIYSKLETNNKFPIILIDSDMLENRDATVREIVSMISTMHCCFTPPVKMKLGVVINHKCDSGTIKLLQETDIIGIVPCTIKYGYDKTLSAMRNIIDNKSHWPKDLIDTIVGKVISINPKKPGIILTNRQQQVMSLVCNRGLSNKKIAQVLQISESTVKVHISAILKEYGVRNRTQLALAGSSSLKG